MNYEEARVYLDQMSKYGSVLGLENMKALLDRLDNPQDELKFIHISGTNGKGSVLAYLSSILQEAGYKTGRYSSPALFSYRERIQIDGEMIDKDSLARYVTVIAGIVEDMRRNHEAVPTVFEIETAMAMMHFKEEKCDIVVLETGLGGALDATNVVQTTLLEIITPIGMDHMDVLGNTLGEIALQKAGIIKEHTRAVTAAQKPEAQSVLEKVCTEKNTILHTVDVSRIEKKHYGWDTQSFSYKDWKDVQISLAGKFQLENAALALEAAEQLREEGFTLTEEQIRKGLKNAQWKGRFSVVSQEPVVILDGAHNPHAAEALKQSLEFYFGGKKIYYVFGVFKDKDYRKIIEITAPLAEHIITVETPGNPRALPAEILKQEVAAVNPSAESAESIESAVQKSLNLMEKNDVLVIFGSLSFLGLAEKAIIRERGKIHG